MLRVEGFPTNGLFPQFQDFMKGGLGGMLADSIHLIIDLSADLAKNKFNDFVGGNEMSALSWCLIQYSA